MAMTPRKFSFLLGNIVTKDFLLFEQIAAIKVHGNIIDVCNRSKWGGVHGVQSGQEEQIDDSCWEMVRISDWERMIKRGE